MVSIILVIGCKEEDGGDDLPDLDQVGIVRLAIFDLEGLSCRFEKRGELFRRHVVNDGMSELKVDANQIY